MIVMNGQRIIQALVNNEWETTGTIKKVEEGIKPGIYNIYLAKMPEDKKQSEGKILDLDKQNDVFYEQTGKDVVIEYHGKKAHMTQANALKKKVLKI